MGPLERAFGESEYDTGAYTRKDRQSGENHSFSDGGGIS